MKVVILAGGFGTRLSEETEVKPKPMVEIGGKPILWHIMKIYSAHGFNDFVILLGYKGYVIKEYFKNYMLHNSDFTLDYASGDTIVHEANREPWRITLLETGYNTMTGGRIKRAAPYIGNERFLLTYGDGVSDIDINKLLDFHILHGKSVTMTAVQPAGRYGALQLSEDNLITDFTEKPSGDGSWINGGFFVCEPELISLISGDDTMLEQAPLQKLALSKNLLAYHHSGFWQCMDTLRDKRYLEELWNSGSPPWLS